MNLNSRNEPSLPNYLDVRNFFALIMDNNDKQENKKARELPLAKHNKFVKDLVQSASPEDLVVMLYDGAIQWLQMAKKELESAESQIIDMAYFNKYMDMASRVIDHLQESLDLSVKAEVTTNLYSIYYFIRQKISDATISKEHADIVSLIEFLQDLRSTWSEVAKLQSQKHPLAQ